MMLWDSAIDTDNLEELINLNINFKKSTKKICYMTADVKLSSQNFGLNKIPLSPISFPDSKRSVCGYCSMCKECCNAAREEKMYGCYGKGYCKHTDIDKAWAWPEIIVRNGTSLVQFPAEVSIFIKHLVLSHLIDSKKVYCYDWELLEISGPDWKARIPIIDDYHIWSRTTFLKGVSIPIDT